MRGSKKRGKINSLQKTRNHGKQHGGCEIRRMNPKLGQWGISSDAGRKNFSAQRPELNNSVMTQLLPIHESGIYR